MFDVRLVLRLWLLLPSLQYTALFCGHDRCKNVGCGPLQKMVKNIAGAFPSSFGVETGKPVGIELLCAGGVLLGSMFDWYCAFGGNDSQGSR